MMTRRQRSKRIDDVIFASLVGALATFTGIATLAAYHVLSAGVPLMRGVAVASCGATFAVAQFFIFVFLGSMAVIDAEVQV